MACSTRWRRQTWQTLPRDAGRGYGFSIGFAWGLGAMLGRGVVAIRGAASLSAACPMPLAAFAILLFCAFMALYAGLAGGLFARLRQGRAWGDAALFAALWLLSEWLRGWAVHRFSVAGQRLQSEPAQPPGRLCAGVRRVWGGGAAGPGWPRWTCQAVLGRRGGPLLAVLVVLAVGVGSAPGRLDGAGGRAGEGRAAADQHRAEPQVAPRDAAALARAQSGHAPRQPGDIVVLPETTLPLLVEYLPPGYLDELQRIAAGNGGDVILGTFTRDGAGHIYNAAISLGRSPSGHYAKQHLVPFGEYSPPLFRWFYGLVNIPMADQTRGAERQPPLALAGQKVA
jgi:apolipoprotein N-acyltransferase